MLCIFECPVEPLQYKKLVYCRVLVLKQTGWMLRRDRYLLGEISACRSNYQQETTRIIINVFVFIVELSGLIRPTSIHRETLSIFRVEYVSFKYILSPAAWLAMDGRTAAFSEAAPRYRA